MQITAWSAPGRGQSETNARRGYGVARRRKRKTGHPTAPAEFSPDLPPPSQTELQRTAATLRKRAGRARALAAIDAGLPTPEQMAKHEYRRVRIKEPGIAQGRLALRNTTASAIDRWYARAMITERQYQAASRYRADYEAAGRERSMISQYGGGTGSGSGTPNYAGTLPATLRQMDALTRWRAARDLLQASLAPVFDAIVLHDIAAEEAVTLADGLSRAAYAARFGPIYVQLAASDLADYYRL